MFYRGDYDCEVVLSSDDDCESLESFYENDEENKRRSFVLGDNLLAYNGLEIIKVRKVNGVRKEENSELTDEKFSQIQDEIYEAIKSRNLSIKDRRPIYDESISDLEEEEVTESEEDTNECEDSVIDSENNEHIKKYKENNQSMCTIDYELPTVGRYQLGIINRPHNQDKTSIEEINQYCLQERKRRMQIHGDNKNFIKNNVDSADSLHKNVVRSVGSNTSLKNSKMHVSNNALPTVPPQENLSNLSIDLLTEYINSDKPLKEIINKSKNQFGYNFNKPKKLKQKHVSTAKHLELMKPKKGKIEIIIDNSLNLEQINQADNECTGDVSENKSEQQKMVKENLRKDALSLGTEENIIKGIYKSSYLLDSKDDLNSSQTSVVSFEEKSHNSIVQFDITQPLLECESNYVDQYLPSLNFTLNVSDGTDEANTSYSNCINYLETFHNKDLTFEDPLISSLSLDSNEYDKSISSSNLKVSDNTSNILSYNSYSLTTSEINIDDPSVLSEISDLIKDGKSKSSLNCNLYSYDKSTSSLDSQMNIYDKSYNSDINESISLIITDHKNEEENMAYIKARHKYLNQLKPLKVSDSKNIHQLAALATSIVNVDDHSQSDPQIIPLENSALNNQNKLESLINKETESISSVIHKQNKSVDKFKESSLPIEVKELIKTSFNRISHYNFLSNDDILEQSDNSLTFKQNVVHLAQEIKANIYEDDSKESESNVYKENQSTKSSTKMCHKSNKSDLKVADKESSIKTTNNNSCIGINVPSQTLTATHNNDNKRSQEIPKKDFNHRTNNPLKKDYNSLYSFVNSTKEINEFLNFQWFKFCEMHTLYNLS